MPGSGKTAGTAGRELPLAGCRVLVIEDGCFLADELDHLLRQSGAEVVGSVADLGEALLQVFHEGFEVAVIDLDLNGQMAHSLADELQQRDVTFVFVSGHGQLPTPARFADVRRWERPLDTRQLVADLARLWPRSRS